jgi:hypothetical protein
VPEWTPTEMQRYAIRHTSGKYLTDKWSGTSWWEGESEKGSPKLFKTLGSAKGWRTNWLKGRLVKEYYKSHYETFSEDECRLTYEPRPNRKFEDLSIIPVTLSFGEPCA